MWAELNGYQKKSYSSQLLTALGSSKNTKLSSGTFILVVILDNKSEKVSVTFALELVNKGLMSAEFARLEIDSISLRVG